jgi:mono/diheme cytochrome c family protein
MNDSPWHRSLATLAACLLLACAVRAEPASHPIVAGFERSGTPDSAAGQLLLTELNCLNCHGTFKESTVLKQAPNLEHVGSRVRVGYLKRFLSNPQVVKPGTSMPQPLAADPERDHKIEALVHFLASTGSVKQERLDNKAISAGRDLYAKVGCVACHGTRDAAGKADKVVASSIPLGDLKTKYTVPSLTAFLDNPHAVRPSGRMPHLLNAKEARDVAQYLMQGTQVLITEGKGSTTYSYYEGDWQTLPNFSTLTPRATGSGAAFDIGVAKREFNYALKFEGFFKIDKEADYTFTTVSDDGSRVLIDGKQVLDNDGIHPPQPRSGKIRLTKGVHNVVVLFFQGGGGAELAVEVQASGFGHQPLAGMVASTEAGLEAKKATVTDPNDPDAIDIQPLLVEKGKQLFVSSGCVACHKMSMDGKPLPGNFKSPALAILSGKGGCLSEVPTPGVPFYSLNTAQRSALLASLKNPAPEPKTPTEIIDRTLLTFNCYACHSRGSAGGPEQALNPFFQTLQPEMGDEGRVPPPLTGVGAKLNPDYLKNLLDKGAHDRPYMLTRMPGFGSANVGHLVAAFDTVDTMPKAAPVTFTEPLTRVKASARFLMGGQAFGCIKCHTFNGIKAEGVQGIDMTLMPRRLKRDWFQAYVENPQVIRPGTRMPASFIGGKSLMTEVWDGKAGPQIEAIWLYLSDGPRAQAPAGMGPNSIPLVPKTTAILYRNFITGAGPRAIGVGYPEHAHLAFDANDMRLAMLWQGAFMDAGRHWTNRGEGFEAPLGDNILHLPSGVSFAPLDKPDMAWPTTSAKAQGYRFLGYRLAEDDRPTFLYQVGDVKVEDFPNAVSGKEPTIRRNLRLASTTPPNNLFLRAAVGDKIESLGDGWYRIDGHWKIKLTSAAAPRIRRVGNKSELLVPVTFEKGTAQIVEEFVW